MEKKYISIDIGGTAIKYGILTEEGAILERYEMATEAYKGGPEILKKAEGIVEGFLNSGKVLKEELLGICISTAGMVDTEKGEIFYSAPLIPNYIGTKFKMVMETRFHVPCEVENDVNCGKYLNQAERVFVCGKGSSGLAASEMELRFMRIGVDIDSLQDSDRMRMQAVFQDKRCLVFGLSISGETEGVRYLLREAHKRGAKTVMITAQNKDSYAEYCSEVLLLPSLRHLNHGNVISPQFPILVMLDLIYSYYVEQDKSKKESFHDNTLRALEEGKVGRRGMFE